MTDHERLSQGGVVGCSCNMSPRRCPTIQQGSLKQWQGRLLSLEGIMGAS